MASKHIFSIACLVLVGIASFPAATAQFQNGCQHEHGVSYDHNGRFCFNKRPFPASQPSPAVREKLKNYGRLYIMCRGMAGSAADAAGRELTSALYPNQNWGAADTAIKKLLDIAGVRMQATSASYQALARRLEPLIQGTRITYSLYKAALPTLFDVVGRVPGGAPAAISCNLAWTYVTAAVDAKIAGADDRDAMVKAGVDTVVKAIELACGAKIQALSGQEKKAASEMVLVLAETLTQAAAGVANTLSNTALKFRTCIAAVQRAQRTQASQVNPCKEQAKRTFIKGLATVTTEVLVRAVANRINKGTMDPQASGQVQTGANAVRNTGVINPNAASLLEFVYLAPYKLLIEDRFDAWVDEVQKSSP